MKTPRQLFHLTASFQSSIWEVIWLSVQDKVSS